MVCLGKTNDWVDGSDPVNSVSVEKENTGWESHPLSNNIPPRELLNDCLRGSLWLKFYALEPIHGKIRGSGESRCAWSDASRIGSLGAACALETPWLFLGIG